MSLANSQYTFADIFNEYYTLYRGQGSNIPVFGDREYTIGIHLANNAVKKWERADGVLWRELINTLQNASDGTKTISSGLVSYTAPTDMRKPPAFIRLYTGDGTNYHDIPVVDPEEHKDVSPTASIAYFLGGAGAGYTMKIPQQIATNYNGYSIDYIYTKKATLFRTDTTPAAVVPQMSDPNFMIQEMVASRAAQSRNGFLYKVAKADATTALQNMKIENNSGTYGHTWKLKGRGSNAGFGIASPSEPTTDGRNLVI